MYGALESIAVLRNLRRLRSCCYIIYLFIYLFMYLFIYYENRKSVHKKEKIKLKVKQVKTNTNTKPKIHTMCQ